MAEDAMTIVRTLGVAALLASACASDTDVGARSQASGLVDPATVPTQDWDPHNPDDGPVAGDPVPSGEAPPVPADYLAKRAAYEAELAVRMPAWAAAGHTPEKIKELRSELKWEHLRPDWTKESPPGPK
jgi:hypothetical protein